MCLHKIIISVWFLLFELVVFSESCFWNVSLRVGVDGVVIRCLVGSEEGELIMKSICLQREWRGEKILVIVLSFLLFCCR